MNKAVLMSIQPRFCELIANGKKTIEIRKNKPKLQTPFKVYIYCIKGEDLWLTQKGVKSVTEWAGYLLNGKVIGEFVCDCMYGISNFLPYDDEPHHSVLPCVLEETCLEDYEIDEYLGAKDGYGWHISNLVIYDQPKELSEFRLPCSRKQCASWCKDMVVEFPSPICLNKGKRFMKRPPQSWCYVEEQDND